MREATFATMATNRPEKMQVELHDAEGLEYSKYVDFMRNRAYLDGDEANKVIVYGPGEGEDCVCCGKGSVKGEVKVALPTAQRCSAIRRIIYD